MLRKIISIITLISFVSYLCGCSSIEVVQLNESNFDDFKDSNIVSVVTKDNKIYEFDYTGVRPKPQVSDSVLKAWVIGEHFNDSYTIHEIEIPVSQLKTLHIKEPDTTSTLLLIGAVLGASIAIILLTFEYNLNFGGVVGK